MRELTRSVASFSWAMSLLGVEQMANLASPRRAVDTFGVVARSAEGVLRPGLRSAFQAGDRIQKAVVDLSFNVIGLGPTGASGGSGLLSQAGGLAFDLIQVGVNTVYWASGTAWQQRQGQSGWGPVPPSENDSRL